METYRIQKDITVFGIRVSTFPQGVGDAFANLMKMLSDNFSRSYYGISFMQDGKMIYLATAVELQQGEAEKYNCEKFIIEKGNYISSTVLDWRNKTDCIKDVFYKIIQDERADKTKPAVEWYKTEAAMMCLVKAIKQ